MNLFLADGSGWWLVPAALVAVVLGVWAYRFAVPAVAPSLRRGLGALRIAALALLLILLARPLLSLAQQGSARTLVVLEDVSLSMALPDSTGTPRSVRAREVGRELERLVGKRAAVQHWRYAGAARAAADSSLGLEPAATNLGAALRAVSQVPDLVGVVVLSDGVITRGVDPVQVARGIGRPVSAVVFGEPPAWDAAVEEVAVSPLARRGEETVLEARLSHVGPQARRARVQVFDGSSLLATRDVTLAPGGEEVVERIPFTPQRLGLLHYRVQLDAGADEPLTDNNVRAAVQRVLPDRQRVLVLASTLQWDWTWLRRAFEADSAYAVEYALSTGRGFRSPVGLPGRASPVEVAPLERYSVVVAQGLSPEALPPGYESALAQYVRNGGSLVLWGGPGPPASTLGEWYGAPLGDALGLAAGTDRVAAEVSPALPGGQAADDLMRFEEDVEHNRQVFSSLPPLTRVFPLAERPGDRVLVAGADGRARLIVLRRVVRGRVLLLNGAGFWRWGISSLDATAPDRYRRFWAQALRLLSEPTQTEPLRVAAERPLLSRGEPVRLSASLQDAQFQPVTGARVSARVELREDLSGGRPAEEVSRELDLTETGDGSYGGVLEPLPPGRYAVEARATSAGGAQRASAEFVVDSWTPEALAVRPDRATLERMAEAAGGSVVEAGQLSELSADLAATLSRPVRWREHRLWEEPYLYLALLGLLGGEWWFRRRRGLP